MTSPVGNPRKLDHRFAMDVDQKVAEFRAGYQAWLDFVGEPDEWDSFHYQSGWIAAAGLNSHGGIVSEETKLVSANEYRRNYE